MYQRNHNFVAPNVGDWLIFGNNGHITVSRSPAVPKGIMDIRDVDWSRLINRKKYQKCTMCNCKIE